ncbi:MAG TPA: oxidoreductase [Solibacterales bacterium]|nr:oxidoreductase [Bryobacterales bacterium]
MAQILITGTSSGIGLAAALELGRAGHRVYATMRNPARSPALAQAVEREGLPVTIHRMDVDSDLSVAECFGELRGQGVSIDVLVNNAGIERHGSTEELPMDDVRAIMETNYFGAIRCIRQAAAAMRERRSGCIVNVSSVAGKISSSPLGYYAASKFALEAVSEALAQEMKPFGVRVAIVEPGIIDTPMAHAIETAPPSLYPHARHLAAMFRAALGQPTPPTTVAAVIRHIVESGTGQLRHPAGPDAAPFLAWRAAMTDEQWIAFNALDDEAYREAVKRDFGLEIEIAPSAQAAAAAD